MILTMFYILLCTWRCECPTHHIHHTSEIFCDVCGATRDSQPAYLVHQLIDKEMSYGYQG